MVSKLRHEGSKYEIDDLIVFDNKALKGKFASTPIYEKVLSEGLSV